MADRFFPLGRDELLIPAYLDTGDEAALERWKQAHPEWFVAGYRTPDPPRRNPSAIEIRSQFPSTGPLPGEGRMFAAPLDPQSLSVADFRATALAAKVQTSRASERPDIIQAQYRSPGRGVPRFQGPQRTLREETLEYRYYDALRTLRRLEPRNPLTDDLRDPTKVPAENTVRKLEQEARDAVLRNAARAPAGAGEPDPATPYQRENLRREMMREGFMSDDGRYDAHHLVPGGGPMSGERDPRSAQDILRKFNIDLDSALNGIALSPNFHRRLHTEAYYRYVRAGLERARSREEVIGFLRRLARRLEMEDTRFQQDGNMPTWSGE